MGNTPPTNKQQPNSNPITTTKDTKDVVVGVVVNNNDITTVFCKIEM